LTPIPLLALFVGKTTPKIGIKKTNRKLKVPVVVIEPLS